LDYSLKSFKINLPVIWIPPFPGGMTTWRGIYAQSPLKKGASI